VLIYPQGADWKKKQRTKMPFSVLSCGREFND